MAVCVRSLGCALPLLVMSACAMPPRVLPPSTQPVIGAWRFWTCDKPCAFTEEPTQETRLTTLVLFGEPPGFVPQGQAAANACWVGDLPAGVPQEPGAGARTGTWRLDPDGVIRLVLAAAAGAGAVLHISVQGEALTGSIETWSCKDGCKQAWYAVDGVRIGKPALERCGR
jgi:hypothetical protein